MCYRSRQNSWTFAETSSRDVAVIKTTAVRLPLRADSGSPDQCLSELSRLLRRQARKRWEDGVAVSEMWASVAPGWAANAGFVDEQLALATEALLDAAQIGEGDRVLDLAAGPGGAGLAAAQRVGSTGRVVLSDVAPRWSPSRPNARAPMLR